MDPKLIMVLLLIGTIIGLSHYGSLAKMKRGFDDQRWHEFVPRWLKP